MLHIISYSYPPDNVPAAHRPYQLATYLQNAGVPIMVHSRFGWRAEDWSPSIVAKSAPTVTKSKLQRQIFSRLSELLRYFMQIDKALPWAARKLPRLLFILLIDRARTGKRPVVWATCPLPSNIYLAGVAAWLTRSELHLDLRDAIDGINGQRAPWMTRFVLSRARSLTAVSETIARYADESRFCPPATVVFNGISSDSRSYSENGIASDSEWIEISYTGGVYGGDRPYIAAIELLSEIACMLPDNIRGIRLTIASREDLSELPQNFGHDRFDIFLTGELRKHDALAMAGASEVNLILVGSGIAHRCAIPLKAFDLLGAGRPILYFGPMDSDAVLFLGRFADDLFFSIDSEASGATSLHVVRSWLLDVRRRPSTPKSEPSSESQCARIAQLLGVMP